jgi:hypothetical protein
VAALAIRHGRDELRGDFDTVQIAQMALNVPHAHAAGIHRDDLLVKAGKASLVLRDELRLKTAVSVPGNRNLPRCVVRQHRLLTVAVAMIARALTPSGFILRRICQVLGPSQRSESAQPEPF